MKDQVDGVFDFDRLFLQVDVCFGHVHLGTGHGNVSNDHQNRRSRNDHNAQVGKQGQAHLIVVFRHQRGGQNDAHAGGEDRGVNGLPSCQNGSLFRVVAHDGLHKAAADVENGVADDVNQINANENQGIHKAGTTAQAEIKHAKDTQGHDDPAKPTEGTGTAKPAFKPIAPETDQGVCHRIKHTSSGDDRASQHSGQTVDASSDIAGKGHQNDEHCGNTGIGGGGNELPGFCATVLGSCFLFHVKFLLVILQRRTSCSLT